MKLFLVILVQVIIALVLAVGIFKAFSGSVALLVIAGLVYLFVFAKHGCASH
jgi:uncharacterized membrane protein